MPGFFLCYHATVFFFCILQFPVKQSDTWHAQ
jgi:hypothetical protein